MRHLNHIWMLPSFETNIFSRQSNAEVQDGSLTRLSQNSSSQTCQSFKGVRLYWKCNRSCCHVEVEHELGFPRCSVLVMITRFQCFHIFSQHVEIRNAHISSQNGQNDKSWQQSSGFSLYLNRRLHHAVRIVLSACDLCLPREAKVT